MRPAVPGQGDLSHQIIVGLPESTAGLDILKVRPRLGGKRLGELLEVPGATPGINHPADMGLLKQQQLRVSGNAAGEIRADIRQSTRYRTVKRENRNRICPAYTGGEGSHGGAQHVHPWIALSHHRSRCDCVYPKCSTVGMVQHLGDPGPQLPGRTKFRHGHELVVIGDQPDADLVERVGDGAPCFDQQPQIVGRCGDHSGKFPACIGASIVKRGAIDGNRPHSRPAADPGSYRDHVVNIGRRTSAQRCGQRIGTQINGHQPAPAVVRAGHQGHQFLGRRSEISSGVDDYRRQLKVNALQPTIDLVRCDTGIADPQQQSADSLRQRLEDSGITLSRGAGEAGRGKVANHLPAGQDVPPAIGTTHEGPVPGQRSLRQGIESGVQRVDRKALVGRRVQQSLRLSRHVDRIAVFTLGEHADHGIAPPGAGLHQFFGLDWGHRQLLWQGDTRGPTIRLNDR